MASGSSAEHARLIHEILIAIGSRADITVWKQTTGRGYTMDGRPIAFGLVGSPDLIGIGPGGRFLGIEVKSGRAKQSDEQRSFQKMVDRMGGIYILARSVECVLQRLKSV